MSRPADAEQWRKDCLARAAYARGKAESAAGADRQGWLKIAKEWALLAQLPPNSLPPSDSD
jgi:hypothetical protein